MSDKYYLVMCSGKYTSKSMEKDRIKNAVLANPNNNPELEKPVLEFIKRDSKADKKAGINYVMNLNGHDIGFMFRFQSDQTRYLKKRGWLPK